MLASEFSEIRKPISGVQQAFSATMSAGLDTPIITGQNPFEKPCRICRAFNNYERGGFRTCS